MINDWWPVHYGHRDDGERELAAAIAERIAHNATAPSAHPGGQHERAGRLTVAEVCAELRIARSTFYEWRAKDRAPGASSSPTATSVSAGQSWSAGCSRTRTRPDGDQLRRQGLEDRGLRRAPGRRAYRVRWSVAVAGGVSRSDAALADAFRSELLRAARRGEAFVIETGRPVSMERAERKVNWLVFAREYAAMKWPQLAPNSRRNTARALTNATLAMVTGDRGRPDDDELRKALALGVQLATRGSCPTSSRMPCWLERNTRDVGDLAKPAVARAVLDGLAVTRTVAPAAPATVQRQRGVLVNLAEYAIERRLLSDNPITALPWKAPKIAQAWTGGSSSIRSRPAPCSTRSPTRGPAGPARGVLRGDVLRRAATGRGVDAAQGQPRVARRGMGRAAVGVVLPGGRSLVDRQRSRREERPLKHRARGETRVVPCPPALTALLHAHLDSFGAGPTGCCSAASAAGDLGEHLLPGVAQGPRRGAVDR